MKTNKKSTTLIIAGAVVLVALCIVAVLAWQPNVQSNATENLQQPDNTAAPYPIGIRQCPDEWIENQMPPRELDDDPEQYFIVDGQRAELADYDLGWVQDNCNVEPSIVY